MDQNDVKSEAVTADSVQVAVQSDYLHAVPTANVNPLALEPDI